MDDTFSVHRLNEAGLAKAGELAKTFETLNNELKRLIGCEYPLFEIEQVRQHLMIACFFAKRAIALRPENQQ